MGDERAPEAAPAVPRRAAGRPRKEPFETRQERLLDEAVAAFAEHGSAASIEVIAGRAGINKALVYQHFPSKSDLYAAAVRRERDRLVAFVAPSGEATAGVDPGRRRGRTWVRGRFHAFIDFADAHPTSLALLAQPEAATFLDGQGRTSISAAVAEDLRGALRRQGLEGDVLPEVLAAMFVGMAGAVIRGGRGGWDREAVVDLMTDFTLAGLAGLDPELLARVDRRASAPDADGPGKDRPASR